MRTRAAVVDEGTKEFEVRELEVDDPGAGEVHVRFVASGLCHSDLHLVDGDLKPRYPMVAGHEGAGIVEAVGPGSRRSRRATTWSAASSPAAAAAATAPPVAPACATWRPTR